MIRVRFGMLGRIQMEKELRDRAHQQHLDDMAGVHEEDCRWLDAMQPDVDEDAEYERWRDMRNEQD
jgi:hypothetical protein